MIIFYINQVSSLQVCRSQVVATNFNKYYILRAMS